MVSLEKEKYSMLKSVVLKGSFNELYEFLCNLKINPIELRDSGNNTLAHLCASNNLLEKLEFLLKFIQKFSHPSHLPLWLNNINKDSMTALHLSVLSGNFALVKFLIDQGADISILSSHGLNLMHLAAKSNNMMMLAYFKKKGLSIVGLDDKGATPLHWASYLGCELSVYTLISWSVSVNIQDNEGLSPLHLASTNGNTQIVRLLLLKGANPLSSDYRGRTPMDFAKDYGFTKVVNLLKPPSLLSTVGIRAPSRPIERKWSLCILFFIFLTIGTCFNLYLDPNFPYSYVYESVAGIQWILLIFIIIKDPGYLKSEKKSLMELCEENESVMICPECVLQRKPRSIHCQVCEKCVEKFDHHCPWINNCVAGKNLSLFLMFILWTEFFLLLSIYYKIQYLSENWEFEQLNNIIKISLAGVIILIEAGFLLPVGLLIIIQFGNFLSGKTTNERFNEESEFDEVDRSSVCKNISSMCCNTDLQIPKRKRSEIRIQYDFDQIVSNHAKEN